MSLPDLRPMLTFYTRADCHLCEEGRMVVQDALEERATRGEPLPRYREVDIGGDPALEATYGFDIPVIELGGQRLTLATSGRQVRAFLDRTLGRLA